MNNQVNYQTSIQLIDKSLNAKAFMMYCELKEVYNELSYYLLLFDIFFKDTEYELQNKDNNAKVLFVIKNWDWIGSFKVYNSSFEYQDAFSYNDILVYFKQKGFPKNHKSLVDEFTEDLNIYRARHILRNEFMIDETPLIILLLMYQRQKEVEAIDKKNEVKRWFMVVVSVITTIASVAASIFSFGSASVSLPAAISGLIGSLAGAASTILGVVDMVKAQQSQDFIKEQTSKTTALMLKNMPKVKNFVDESITDPYAMYANGRHWTEGGAGKDEYDQLTPYTPYKALIDEDFSNSDMYEILNNKRDTQAGGDQYFSELYEDAKWSNPSSLKAILNGAIPIYLNMRQKLTDALFKWLTNEDLGTFYLLERNYNNADTKLDSWWTGLTGGRPYNWWWWDRYSFIEFEDYNSVRGFTKILLENKTPIDEFVWSNDRTMGNIVTKHVLGYNYPISVEYDKQEDDKTTIKKASITNSINKTFLRKETKILKGNQIKLTETIIKKYVNFGDNGTHISQKQHFDSNTSYECEYNLYDYGGVEVYKYLKISEIIGNSKKLLYEFSESDFIETLEDKYIWEVRKELSNVSIRFKPRQAQVLEEQFINEELKSEPLPKTITKKEDAPIFIPGLEQQGERVTEEHYYRSFDQSVEFAYIKYDNMIPFFSGYVCLGNDYSKYAKVTIYYNNDNSNAPVTYFNISPFLSAQQSIVYF